MSPGNTFEDVVLSVFHKHMEKAAREDLADPELGGYMSHIKVAIRAQQQLATATATAAAKAKATCWNCGDPVSRNAIAPHWMCGNCGKPGSGAGAAAGSAGAGGGTATEKSSGPERTGDGGGGGGGGGGGSIGRDSSRQGDGHPR